MTLSIGLATFFWTNSLQILLPGLPL